MKSEIIGRIRYIEEARRNALMIREDCEHESI